MDKAHRKHIPLPDFELLASLEHVDASVFEGADKDEQSVCDLVLTLALVYNDLKDLLWANKHIQEQSSGEFELSPYAGQVHGMAAHCDRLLHGFFYELLILIAKTEKQQAHPLFTSVISRIDREHRAYWGMLVEASSGKPNTDPMVRFLLRARNDIAFHYYGTENLARGYKMAYDGSGHTKRKIYVSRGMTAYATRFHFADGAAQSAMDSIRDPKTDADVSAKIYRISDFTRHALYSIVTRFMEDRAKGWERD
jgi:hypothetical protein